MLAPVLRELRRGDERGDARGERRWRQAPEILPAVQLRQWALADDELRRRADHRRVRVVVEAACDAEPPCQQDRQRDLVELRRGPVRRTVDVPVLKPGAVGTLSRLEVAERAQRRGRIAGVEEGGRHAAQIARPDHVVDVVAVVVRLAPGRAGRGDVRTRSSFVLEAAKHRKRRFRERSIVAAHLRQCRGQVRRCMPCARERCLQRAGAFLQHMSRDLFRVSA